MTEADRPRKETPEEMFERKVEPRLKEEILSLEYRNIAEELSVLIDLTGDFQPNEGLTIQERMSNFTKIVLEYQKDLIDELSTMGKETKSTVLSNSIRADLTPGEIRRFSLNEKVARFTWNRLDDVGADVSQKRRMGGARNPIQDPDLAAFLQQQAEQQN